MNISNRSSEPISPIKNRLLKLESAFNSEGEEVEVEGNNIKSEISPWIHVHITKDRKYKIIKDLRNKKPIV